jgi:hypothetical protein
MTLRTFLPRLLLALALAGVAIALALNRERLDPVLIERSIHDLGVWAPIGHAPRLTASSGSNGSTHAFDGLPDQRRLPHKGSWLKGEVGAAVRQARDYARTRGVGFAAVTNGDAWIVFPVNRRDLVSSDPKHGTRHVSPCSALPTLL